MPSPSALRLDSCGSLGAAQEVVAIKDYSPSSFTTLRFSRGDRLFVLDASGGEWWYAHNNTEMGYIPAAYVEPVGFRSSSLSDSGMIDSLGEALEDGSREGGGLGEWTGGPAYKPSSLNPFTRPRDQNSKDLILFDSSCSGSLLTPHAAQIQIQNQNQNQDPAPSFHRENPFFRSKRSHSLSELSVLQAQANPTLPSSGFFTGGSRSRTLVLVQEPGPGA